MWGRTTPIPAWDCRGPGIFYVAEKTATGRFFITDSKPSYYYEGQHMYKNVFGLDRRIVNKVLDEAVMCRREGITITTFMIARDPYLQGFVRQLTEANQERAYYASLDKLGEFLFEDYVRNRRKQVR